MHQLSPNSWNDIRFTRNHLSIKGTYRDDPAKSGGLVHIINFIT